MASLYSIYLALVIALIFLVSCASSPENASPAPIQLTDQLGRTVKLDKIPQRIISLAPSNTEILYALGLGDKVVGVTSFDDYPPDVKQKPVIGGFTTPNIEKIVALSPDLILATHNPRERSHSTTRTTGIDRSRPQILKPWIKILQAITLVGKITGREKEASNVIAGMQTKIKTITDVTGKLSQSQRPRTFYITWNDPLMTVGSGNLDDELIRMAGGNNIASNLKGSTTITLEEVVQANPEVIIAGIGMGTGGDLTLQLAMNEPRIGATDAHKNNRIYSVDMDYRGACRPSDS